MRHSYDKCYEQAKSIRAVLFPRKTGEDLIASGLTISPVLTPVNSSDCCALYLKRGASIFRRSAYCLLDTHRIDARRQNVPALRRESPAAHFRKIDNLAHRFTRN